MKLTKNNIIKNENNNIIKNNKINHINEKVKYNYYLNDIIELFEKNKIVFKLKVDDKYINIGNLAYFGYNYMILNNNNTEYLYNDKIIKLKDSDFFLYMDENQSLLILLFYHF